MVMLIVFLLGFFATFLYDVFCTDRDISYYEMGGSVLTLVWPIYWVVRCKEKGWHKKIFKHFVVVKESFPVRCETCHQLDCYHPAQNHCTRCDE